MDIIHGIYSCTTMGVKGLFKLIKELAPGAIKTVKLTDLAGWTIGVDVSLAVYQWCSIGCTRNIKNAAGKYINHIQGAFFHTVRLLNAGIKPVMIFDGAPPDVKAGVIAKRKESRDNGTSLRIPSGVFEEVAKLYDLLGVQVVHAVSEAEAQAAVMCRAGLLDGILTDDIDALVFGAKYMIKGLDSPHSVILIELAAVLKELNLTQDELIDLSILLGCDYAGTLKGIGPKTALRLIRKYSTIEAILNGEKIVDNSFKYLSARMEFKNPKVSRVMIKDIKKLSAEDVAKLKDFLINVHGIQLNRIANKLSTI